ncbi:USP6 N-terminal-like protein [Seminavis robusta]|uniref:USP6 N-terminal-like protein n=1 Tax=Seminavis robusta TaxID=568900 RepID=A0A9N8DAT7_9STRA|nr:USP6 N-terminal-like protein [Seminavis robusta]|eukprot:Sro61_g035150.1 USP6 N-terminal-like protein (605) ;mRNA; r:113173-115339
MNCSGKNARPPRSQIFVLAVKEHTVVVIVQPTQGAERHRHKKTFKGRAQVAVFHHSSSRGSCFMTFISSRRDQDRIPIPLKRTPHQMPPNTVKSSSDHGGVKGNNNSSMSSNNKKPDGYQRAASTGHSPTSVQNQRVDRFGFITNIDNATGKLSSSDTAKTPPATEDIAEENKRVERREKKWNNMMASWDTTNSRRHKLVLNRLRKGLPDSMRGKVWPLLGGVPKKMREGSSTKGIYKALLKQCEQDNQHALDHMPPEGPNTSMSQGLMVRSNSFQNIQETIERDIHRTFPRHSLFYDEENHKDDLPTPKAPKNNTVAVLKPPQEEDEDDSQQGLGALCNEDLSTLIMELDFVEDKKSNKGDSSSSKSSAKNKKDKATPTKPAVPLKGTCESIVEAKGGQAALRRVLCAYSYYDRDVGYCQGMNFIAGMFITIMSEEEAFWMLVAVMNDDPCRMRGLFGKGMAETHKVLYVAEKLLHHFLPKLAKHLDKEHVHVTMYATQWLLTQYTSSFNFDLVTRVWDCFLVEGFKTIYRVMLAILQQIQPILLKKSFEEILGFFRDLPDQVEGNEIIETAMKIPLKRKHIAKYENEWLAQQQQQQDNNNDS